MAVEDLRFENCASCLVSKPAGPSFLVKNGVDRLTCMLHKLDRFTQHFSDVLNCEKSVGNDILLQIPCVPSFPEAQALSEPLTVAEIIRALCLLQKAKVAGEDGISVELLQLRESAVLEAMKKLADLIWKQKSVLANWRKQRIVPIFKNKGSRGQYDYSCGISLLNAASEVIDICYFFFGFVALCYFITCTKHNERGKIDYCFNI